MLRVCQSHISFVRLFLCVPEVQACEWSVMGQRYKAQHVAVTAEQIRRINILCESVNDFLLLVVYYSCIIQ